MNNFKPYQVKEFFLNGLNGMSDQTLDLHFKLYAGYVKETNLLMEEIAEFYKNGKVGQENLPAYSDLKRRLSFEYNGMALHEYYFGNLMKGGNGEPETTSAFYQAVEASFGSYEIWKADFIGIGQKRGVGWAICYHDPLEERLSNHWITLHQIGNIAGFNPALVLDVWEHAFLLDYKPTERLKYIEIFFSNVDWQAVERRLQQAKSVQASAAGR